MYRLRQAAIPLIFAQKYAKNILVFIYPVFLFYQGNDLVQIVGYLYGRVAEFPGHFTVIVDGDVGVFEGMAGQDAGDTLIFADDAVGQQVFEAGDGGGGGRFAAEAVLCRSGLWRREFLHRSRQHDAIADIEGTQAFFEIDRPGDFDGRGEGVGAIACGIQFVVIGRDDSIVGMAVVPAELFIVDQVGQCVGAGGVDDRHTRDAVDQAEVP